MATNVHWHEPFTEPFRLTGFPWYANDQRYRRLPARPAWPLPAAVDHLADHTAGGQIAFRTTSRRIWVKARLKGPADMVHMPATGQCGFDLYWGHPRTAMFYGATKYDMKATEYEYELFHRPEAAWETFILNFPLYQGVEEVYVGLDEDAAVEKPPAFDTAGRVIFYGTSITQGGCASRPGMAYTNILSRRLNVETVNLGFSGNGKGEAELAHIVSQIQRPACLVLDYEANCVSTELLRETLPRFIRIYRDRWPHVPILVVSRIPFSHDVVHPETMQARRERGAVQKETVARWREQGDENIHFLDGNTFFTQAWDECTVDGIHPNDLGFMLMAQGMEPVLRRLLDATEAR